MEVTRILAEIDAQITKLQQARALLAGAGAPTAAIKNSVGRPRKSVTGLATVSPKVATRKQRNLSPEARKRIADAQRRRWAERRKDS